MAELSDRVAKLESDMAKVTAKVFPKDRQREIANKIHDAQRDEMNKIADQVKDINNSNATPKEKAQQIKELSGLSKKRMQELNDELNERYRR